MARQEVALGAVHGPVRAMLRLEGLALLAAATLLYAAGEHSWWLFALLFFAPDFSLLAYLAGHRVGAGAYNLAHSTVGPLTVGAASLATGDLAPFALIWAAHVGFDRALGYGLKYPTSFDDTHLGRVGRGRQPTTGTPGG